MLILVCKLRISSLLSSVVILLFVAIKWNKRQSKLIRLVGVVRNVRCDNHISFLYNAVGKYARKTFCFGLFGLENCHDLEQFFFSCENVSVCMCLCVCVCCTLFILSVYCQSFIQLSLVVVVDVFFLSVSCLLFFFLFFVDNIVGVVAAVIEGRKLSS